MRNRKKEWPSLLETKLNKWAKRFVEADMDIDLLNQRIFELETKIQIMEMQIEEHCT